MKGFYLLSSKFVTTLFFTGSLSPVAEDSSIMISLDNVTIPSTGITSPVSTYIKSPTKISYIEILITFPSLVTFKFLLSAVA